MPRWRYSQGMTIDEVLALADKARLWYPAGSSAKALRDRSRLVEFARLVEMAERERCEKSIAPKNEQSDWTMLRKA